MTIDDFDYSEGDYVEFRDDTGEIRFGDILTVDEDFDEVVVTIVDSISQMDSDSYEVPGDDVLAYG